MSTATDLANAEADAVEAELPAEGEDEEAAGEQEEVPAESEQESQAAQAPLTEQQADRLFKRLETAAQRYLKTAMPITEELGMPVRACPLCTFPGLAIPRQAHEVTSDVEGAVLALIGKTAPRNLKVATDAEMCPDCDGEGDVLTGAKKDIAREKPCTRCGGKGWIATIQPYVAPPAPAQPAFSGANITYTPLPGGIADQWGRPAGHPHWGLDPAMVGSPNGTQVG